MPRDQHDGPHDLTVIKRSWPEHETRTDKYNETTLWTRHCADVQCSKCDHTEVICGEWGRT
jgi:hypothetical protein